MVGVATIRSRRAEPGSGEGAGWAAGAAKLAVPVAFLVVARLVMAGTLGLVRGLTIAHVPPLEAHLWDSSWYLQAAKHGWPESLPVTGGHVASSTLAFFPAFPETIRWVHWLSGAGWMASASAAALACEVFMVLAVWLLAADHWDSRAANRAVLVLCFFPGAYIFALWYSEALMIGLSAVCLLALRRRWWVLAGLAAALATATRPNAVALVLACAVAAVPAIAERREWRSLAAVVLAPAGLVGWFAYLWASTGARLAWLRTEQGGWGERIEPLAFLHLVRHEMADGLLRYPNEYVTVLSTLGAVVLFVLMVRTRVPATWVAFAAVVLVMAFMSKTLGLRPRFVLTAFPLVMALGARLKDSALGLVAAASASLMVALLVVTTTGMTLTP